MPKEGTYNLTRCDFDIFKIILKDCFSKNDLKSYIGYQQNVDFIKEKIGISVDLCRDETIINSGDRLLIMRLKYRVNPADKGKIVNEDDFEFFFANFQ